MRKTTIYRIELDKTGIEDIIASMPGISRTVALVAEGVDPTIDRMVGSKVSLALIAVSRKPYQDYLIGYAENIELHHLEGQKSLLAVNRPMVGIEKAEFRENELYISYELCLINPSQGLFDFIDFRPLAPYSRHRTLELLSTPGF